MTEDASRLSRFGEVDASGHPEKFVRFLEATDAIPEVRARRRRSYELLEVHQDDAVADVGCGIGTAAREVAELVGRSGRVVGIDNSEAMIEVARSRVQGAEVPLVFEVADATDLPLADGSIDGYRAERLYQHLPDVGAALAGGAAVLPDAHLHTDFTFWEPLLSQIVGPAVQDGAVAEEEAVGWLAEQRRRAAEGGFLAGMTHYIASARRP